MESSTSQSAPEQAKEKVQQATQQASEQARSRVTDVVSQRSTDAGEQVNSAAQALRQTSSQLRESGKDAPARAMEAAADRIEGLGSWLRDSDGDAILHDIENFGRRKPTAVMFGALALGFAASRVLRASSSQRFQSRGDGAYSYGTTGYTGRAGTMGAPPVSSGVGALSGSPTSGYTAEGDTTSAPTSRMGVGDLGTEPGQGTVGGEGQGFTPPRGA
jgi:hypothetical protein